MRKGFKTEPHRRRAAALPAQRRHGGVSADDNRRMLVLALHMGRPPNVTLHQRQEALVRRRAGIETLVDIARSYNVSHATISRLQA
jgi:hypothetical protein